MAWPAAALRAVLGQPTTAESSQYCRAIIRSCGAVGNGGVAEYGLPSVFLCYHEAAGSHLTAK
jgi:hypothetical protein